MRLWLRIALAGQLVFFMGWAGLEEWRHHSGVTLLLETEGYDPRDLLSGQYLQLNYPIRHVENLRGFPRPEPVRPMEIWVRLEPLGSVKLGLRSYNSYRAAEVSQSAPLVGQAKWAKARWAPGSGAVYGIERYYFSEARKESMQGLRSGRVWVEAQLPADGQLRLLDIVRQ